MSSEASKVSFEELIRLNFSSVATYDPVSNTDTHLSNFVGLRMLVLNFLILYMLSLLSCLSMLLVKPIGLGGLNIDDSVLSDNCSWRKAMHWGSHMDWSSIIICRRVCSDWRRVSSVLLSVPWRGSVSWRGSVFFLIEISSKPTDASVCISSERAPVSISARLSFSLLSVLRSECTVSSSSRGPHWIGLLAIPLRIFTFLLGWCFIYSILVLVDIWI